MTAADRDVIDAIEPRYAVYFAPDPAHSLWDAGCRWLGRDARLAIDTPPSRPHVSTPWRYGWHATLAAPTRLGAGIDEAAWLDAVRAVASRHRPIRMPMLRVAALSDFLALRPIEALDEWHPLRRLADDCVRSLAPLAAPLSPAERKRRLHPDLTERQREQVERFGYPSVLDDWRFHMTLTDSLLDLGADRVRRLFDDATVHFAGALAPPLWCDALCVFVEPAPGAPLRWRHVIRLWAA